MTELVEQLAEAAHDAWMESKRQQGVTSRRSEWGEELMVPYAELSESAKDLDRSTVRGVLAAAAHAGYELQPIAAEARVRTQVAQEIAEALYASANGCGQTYNAAQIARRYAAEPAGTPKEPTPVEVTIWVVDHPGLGILGYDTEADARLAAGTAGTLLRAVGPWRTVKELSE